MARMLYSKQSYSQNPQYVRPYGYKYNGRVIDFKNIKKVRFSNGIASAVPKAEYLLTNIDDLSCAVNELPNVTPALNLQAQVSLYAGGSQVLTLGLEELKRYGGISIVDDYLNFTSKSSDFNLHTGFDHTIEDIKNTMGLVEYTDFTYSANNTRFLKQTLSMNVMLPKNMDNGAIQFLMYGGVHNVIDNLPSLNGCFLIYNKNKRKFVISKGKQSVNSDWIVKQEFDNPDTSGNNFVNITITYDEIYRGNKTFKFYLNGEIKYTETKSSSQDLTFNGTYEWVYMIMQDNMTSLGRGTLNGLKMKNLRCFATVLTPNEIKQIMRYDGII